MKKKFLIGSFILVGMMMFSFTEALVSMPDPTPTPTPISTAATVQGVCSANDMTNVTGIVNWATCFLFKSIVPLLFALATAAFIWGVMEYYLNPGNEEKRKKGKDFIFGGLLALFLMTSMWGIVKVFTTTFGIKNAVPQLPE